MLLLSTMWHNLGMLLNWQRHMNLNALKVLILIPSILGIVIAGWWLWWMQPHPAIPVLAGQLLLVLALVSLCYCLFQLRHRKTSQDFLSQWSHEMQASRHYCIFHAGSPGQLQVFSSFWKNGELQAWIDQWPGKYPDLYNTLNRDGHYHGIIFHQDRAWLALLVKKQKVSGVLLEYPYERLTHQFKLHQQAIQGQIISGIMHDLNNILMSWTAVMELLPLSDAAQKEHLLGIMTTLNQEVQQLVKEIRKVRVTEDNTATVALKRLLKECMDLFQIMLPKTIEIHICLPETDVQILSNPTHLRQIFMNLLLNAKDAILQKQAATRENQAPAPGIIRMELRINPENTHATVDIQDNGCGIAKDCLDKIWQPFYTTKGSQGGSGLGLAMVQHLLHVHNGHVLVASSNSEGTLFRVFLPLKTTVTAARPEKQLTLDAPSIKKPANTSSLCKNITS